MNRPCIECGRVIPSGSRCDGCRLPGRTPAQDREHYLRRREARVPERVRRQVLARAAGVCELCHERATSRDPLEVDHSVAVALGGTADWSNLRAIHRSHNAAMGAAVGRERKRERERAERKRARQAQSKARRRAT